MQVTVWKELRAGESLTVGFPAAASLLLFAGLPVGDNRAVSFPRHHRPAPTARLHRFLPVKPILLDYGSADPLVLEPSDADVAFDARGPAGVGREAGLALAAAAIDTPTLGPALASHVVPGDRVTLACCSPLPFAEGLLAMLRDRLASAGVSAADIAVLHAPPWLGSPPGGGVPAGGSVFDPLAPAESAFLGPDAEGQPMHVARLLVDADVVVAIGTQTWDAALGGASLDADLWPAFATASARADILRRLARSGRRTTAALRERSREIGWQLGVIANLRVVPGQGESIHAVEFGMPHAAGRAARGHAEGWRPRLPGSARLSIASLAAPQVGLAALVRAVAAAASTTHPEGTICIASRFATPPGPVFQRWRQGVALVPLVQEALASGDETLIADAVTTRFFAKALGDRRLVLLSELDQGIVEDLEFGYAANPEAVERLAHRAESLVVLHDGERMYPRRA